MADVNQVRKVLSERGCLVFSTNAICAAGEVITNLMSQGSPIEGVPKHHPFQVLCETDREEFEEQARVAGWSIEGAPYPGVRYYRCTTD